MVIVAAVIISFAGLIFGVSEYSDWRKTRKEASLRLVLSAACELRECEHFAKDHDSAKAGVDYTRALAEMDRAEKEAYKAGAEGYEVSGQKFRAEQGFGN